MRAHQRVAQHGEAAMAGMAALPLAQGLLAEPFDQFAGRRQPVADRRIHRGPERHIKQPRLARDETGDAGAAPGLEIRGFRQVEPVEPRQRRLHPREIRDLRLQRLGVLHFQGLGQLVEPPRDAQPIRETVEHLDRLRILIIDIEGRLSRALQRVLQRHLKLLQPLQMGLELLRVEARRRGFAVLRVAQLPLAGGARDHQADIALDRVAGQHDLRAFRIVHEDGEHPRIVIVEIAAAVQPVLRFDRAP